jgi:hypothetical protein
MVEFRWEEFKNYEVIRLRKQFQLNDVVSPGKDEFEKQLLLKEWVYNTLPLGNPEKDYVQDSAFEILKEAIAGKPMYCTQYAFTYLQCGVALGWYTRKLGIDVDHEFGVEEMHHGVVDIWSNQLQKWYVIDPMHNLHFEKDNIPLNVLEVRKEYIKNYADDVTGVIGNRKSVVRFSTESRGFNTPSNYFWFFISLRNNFFTELGLYNTKTLLWIDEYNKDKVWYKGGGKKGELHKHPMYQNQFIKTSDKRLSFPKM